MSIDVQLIKKLREETGAGVLETKETLVSTNGDYDEAVKILREKGAIKAAKHADRITLDGVVELYAHPGSRVGVILELNCETMKKAKNFVARRYLRASRTILPRRLFRVGWQSITLKFV
jgi:elongation factor Ts